MPHSPPKRGRTILSSLILVIAASAIAGGCNHNYYTLSYQYEKGLVVLLSGAGGMMGETERIRQGLADGGVDYAIETFEWSGGEVLSDQTAVESNRRKASQLARRAEAYARDYPGRPIFFIGVSAGTGLTVWALEDMRPGYTVTGAVLISSSLDTKYDLGRALGHVSDRIWSFKSAADTVLSLGVTWTGTVDRRGGIAGGLVGFSPPDGASAATKALYKEKLSEYGWWPGDVVLGHLGDHLGATNPAFVKTKIAPILLGKTPSTPPAPPPAEKVKAEETPKAAPPKAAPAKTAPPGAAPDAKDSSKGRFFHWNVGKEAPQEANKFGSTDEAPFFSEPRRLP